MKSGSVGISILIIFIMLTPPAVSAADVDVYAEGAYTENDLHLYLYADINGPNILSFGIRVLYDPSELIVSSAQKNESVWYLGDGTTKYAYMDPDTSVPGEVVIIGGRLDTGNPAEGVWGLRVLLGKIIFTRTEASMPFSPSLSLLLGRDDVNYSNFTATNGTSLDASGVSFNGVITAARGDVNADMVLNILDFGEFRRVYLFESGYRVFADCNADEVVDIIDYGCLRAKIFMP